MGRSLKSNIKKYINSKPIRLHMPGHKGRCINGENLYEYDITELKFSDNLMDPTAEIDAINESLAETYGVKKAFTIIGGGSCGIVAAILSSIREGEKILVPRNSHISVYYGIYFSKAEPIYFYPKNYANKGELIFTAEDYIEIISREKDIKVVFLTYPTYYGSGFDIKGLCKKLRDINNKIIIIIDQAHGAHLNFANSEDDYPVSATKADCDLVITSIHKTLGGMNGSAALFVVSDKIDISKVKLFLKMTQTTSPSYPIICSVEDSIKEAVIIGNNKLREIKKLYVWADKVLREKTSLFLENFKILKKDYFKMVVSTEHSKLSGYKIYEILINKYNIYAEFATEDIILAYLGIRSNYKDIHRFIDALIEIDNQDTKIEKKNKEHKIYKCTYKTKKAYDIHEALSKDSKISDINKSIGEISADFIIPYPPGYPILVPGEIISENIASYLEEIYNIHKVVGVNKKGKLKIIKNSCSMR